MKKVIVMNDADIGLFDDVNKYNHNFKKLGELVVSGKSELMKKMCNEVGNPEELIEFIKDNQEWFMANGRMHNKAANYKEGLVFDKLEFNGDSFGDNELIWRQAVPNGYGWKKAFLKSVMRIRG